MKHTGLRYGLYLGVLAAGFVLTAAVAAQGRHHHAPRPDVPTISSQGVEPAAWIASQPQGSEAPARGAARALELARAEGQSKAGDAPTALEPTNGAEHGAAAGARRLRSSMVTSLADRCAPTAPATVLASIVQVESGGDPLKIGVNGALHRVYSPVSKPAAVALARQLIARGDSIDLGLAQINSRNLGGLGLSLDEVFDPCANLAAAATMINRGYAAALKAGEPNRPILQMAYSIYNSGDQVRGIANGYAARVEAAQTHRR